MASFWGAQSGLSLSHCYADLNLFIQHTLMGDIDVSAMVRTVREEAMTEAVKMSPERGRRHAPPPGCFSVIHAEGTVCKNPFRKCRRHTSAVHPTGRTDGWPARGWVGAVKPSEPGTPYTRCSTHGPWGPAAPRLEPDPALFFSTPPPRASHVGTQPHLLLPGGCTSVLESPQL